MITSSSDTEFVIAAEGLGKRYRIGDGRVAVLPRPAKLLNMLSAAGRRRQQEIDAAEHFWALRNISFRVRPGERIGIIGRNGAGKSTLLKILSRVTIPTEGKARIRGRLTSLLEVGTGFNDKLTGRENIFLNAGLHGLSREEIAERLDEIIDFSEIRRFIDMPVKHYSSGMRSRLAFSVAAHLEPDALLLDEVLAVGDLAFQRKCLERMQELTSSSRALLFVSHAVDNILRFCDRCIWLDSGTLRLDGPAREVTEAYVSESLATNGARGVRILRPAAEAAGSDLPEPASPAEAEVREAPPQQPIALGATTADPGEDAVKLLSAGVIDETHKPILVAPVSARIGITFEYQVMIEGYYVPAIHIFAPDGQMAFVSAPANPDTEYYRLPPGRYVSTAWIPPNLLNIGQYTATVALVDPLHSPLKRHVQLDRSLDFQVLEADAAELPARGLMPRAFPGPVRPKLEWHTAAAAPRPRLSSTRIRDALR